MKKALLALALIASPALAVDFPPLDGKPVIDAAHVFSDDEKAALDSKLFGIEHQTHHLIVVMTVSDTQGETPESFANEAFRNYHLGNKTRNDGVLLLVQPQDSTAGAHDHFARIEVGYGLEPTLTDAISDLIIRNDMAPHFKQGDYVGGINAGVDSINQTISTDKVADAPKSSDTTGWWLFGILLVLLIGGTWLFLRRKMKQESDILSPDPEPLRSHHYDTTPDYYSSPSSYTGSSSDDAYLASAASAATMSESRQSYSPPTPPITSSSNDDDDAFKTSSTPEPDPSPSFDTSSSDTSSSDTSFSSSDFGGSSGGGGATDSW